MTARDVWVRWEGEHIVECALRPSNEGAWTKYVPASDLLPVWANVSALTAERNRLATDSGIKSEILEEVANGTTAPTREAIQARHDRLWVEASKK
jgi:hypothetical protein